LQDFIKIAQICGNKATQYNLAFFVILVRTSTSSTNFGDKAAGVKRKYSDIITILLL
jgi:hypothetical protein